VLIRLCEALSGRVFASKYNRNRKLLRSQQLENVSLALKFLQEVEGIKLVNIGWFWPFF
jgi:hypothetical protein